MLRRVVVLVLMGVLGAAGWLAAPAGADEPTAPPATYFTVSGVGGDYITQDKSWFAGLGEGEVTVTGSTSGVVTVTASGGTTGAGFTADLAAAPGQVLVAGVYPDAERASFRTDGHPGLDVSGNYRGCNTVEGSFTVKEIAEDLSRLWVTFEQHCERGRSAAFGEIKIGLPGSSTGLEPAPASVRWPSVAARSAQSVVPVLVQNTTATPMTVMPSIDGPDDFSIVRSTCDTVEPGALCKVAVGFAPILKGSPEGTLVLTDGAGAATEVPLAGSAYAAKVSGQLSADRTSSYRFGATAAITATMSGSWVAPTVSLYRTTRGGSPELVGAQAVDDAGTAVFDVVVVPNVMLTLDWTDGDRSGHDYLRPNVRKVDLAFSHSRAPVAAGERTDLLLNLHGAPTQDVTIYRKLKGEDPVRLTRVRVPASGHLDVPIRPDLTASYIATWEYDGEVLAQDEAFVNVEATVDLTPRRYARKAGSYYLYRPGSKVLLDAAVAPRRPGDCVTFTLQVQNHGWDDAGTTGCVRLSSASKASVYLSYDPVLLGRGLRFIAHYAGAKHLLGNSSEWVYVRFAR